MPDKDNCSLIELSTSERLYLASLMLMEIDRLKELLVETDVSEKENVQATIDHAVRIYNKLN